MIGEEDKLFDELLRKSLEQYEVPPPPGVWNTVKHKLFTRQSWQSVLFKGNTGLIGSISTGVIITGLTAWYIAGKMDTPSVAQDTATHTQSAFVNKDIVEKITSSNQAKAITDRGNAIVQETESSSGNNITEVNPVTAKNDNYTLIKEYKKTRQEQNNQSGYNKSSRPVDLISLSAKGAGQDIWSPTLSSLTTIKALYRINIAASVEEQFIDPFQLSSMDRNEMLELLKKDLRSNYDYARPDISLSLGLSAANDRHISTDNCLPSSRFNSNIFIRVKRERLFLETGLGITREKSSISRNTKYLPLIGIYNNLDSITFTYDPGQGPIPNYHYSNASVYDSVEKTNISNISTTYVYANIPVLAGYEFNFKRHSLLLKTGIIFSILVNKSGASVPLNISEGIITSSGELGIRKTTYSQWTVEANYEYLINDSFSAFLGPVYSAFLDNPFRDKQAYRKNDAYFGLKTGLIWNF